MSATSAVFDTFTLERHLPVPPRRVFGVFSDPKAKAALTDDSDDGTGDGTGDGTDYLEFEFTVGGRERFDFLESDGRQMTYDAIYYDIVDDQRIVYSYEMTANGARISVSVATIQFVPTTDGTTLTWTEQGVYLDGLDQPELRRGGTDWMIDNLVAKLTS
jgi:uncharacterized protein YndB with AHSA1/START domain